MEFIKEKIPKIFEFVYASKTQSEGLYDCVKFFPDMFRLNTSCLLLMSVQNLEDMTMVEKDPLHEYFRRLKLRLLG